MGKKSAEIESMFGARAHAEAVEQLTRAVRLDPARATDRAMLERIKADPVPTR